MNNKVRFLNVFILVITVSLFIYMSYLWSQTLEIRDDTLVYHNHFYEIIQTPFVYGIEFVASSTMYFVRLLGGSFKAFLFIMYLSWLVVVVHFIKMARFNLLYLMSLAFFFTGYFFENSGFLIRQYLAALFYFIYLNTDEKNKKTSFIFMMLSVFSHLSSLAWLVFSSRKVVGILSGRLTFFIMSMLTLFFYNFSIFKMLIDFLALIDEILQVDALHKKITFYSGQDVSEFASVNSTFLTIALGCYSLSYLFLVFSKNTDFYTQRILSIIILQSFFIIIFHENIVLANRMGFLVYFFSIPCIIYIVVIYYDKLKRYLK